MQSGLSHQSYCVGDLDDAQKRDDKGTLSAQALANALRNGCLSLHYRPSNRISRRGEDFAYRLAQEIVRQSMRSSTVRNTNEGSRIPGDGKVDNPKRFELDISAAIVPGTSE